MARHLYGTFIIKGRKMKLSTRSFIAKEIGDNQYRTIYCHSDGYLTYNGAMLVDHYNTHEAVDELLNLGDISSLGERTNPDPDRPHKFDYDMRQKGVTVAYGRDRGDKNTDARVMSLAELDDPNNWTAYVYIFTQDNEWKYFEAGQSGQGLRSVSDDLSELYSAYGLKRPEGFYGFLSGAMAKYLKSLSEENDPAEISMS